MARVNYRTLTKAVIGVFLLSIGLPNGVAAESDLGNLCPKAGAIKIASTNSETCVKVGTRLIWQVPAKNPSEKPSPALGANSSLVTDVNILSGALKKTRLEKEKDLAKRKEMAVLCATKGECQIGGIGPGGGIIFYDAGSRQTWGRFLEVAPQNWNGTATDPTASWCNIVNVFFKGDINDPSALSLLGYALGKGKGNTALMIAEGCTSGAGVLADRYVSGGKTDWFLPSKDELNALFRARSLIGGFTVGYYWSSSDFDRGNAWDQNFADGAQNLHTKDRKTVYVRPIRSF